jgi:phosphoserine aminotransferase
MTTKPGVRPARPYFSSGPCAKRPGWSAQDLGTETLGRSHRAKLGKARLKEAIDRTRALLEAPDDYRIGIVPASDTGAVEMALWSLPARDRSPCSPGRASAKGGSPMSSNS